MDFGLFSSNPSATLFVCVMLAGCVALIIAQAIRNRSGRLRDEQTIMDLQARMTHLAAEIRALEHSDSPSKNHHVRAAQIAYDGLLAEACKKAGLHGLANVNPSEEPTVVQRMLAEAYSLDVVPEAAPRPSASRGYTDSERMERELTLAELGWVW